MKDPILFQWILLISFGILFFFLAPFSKTAEEFFSAKTKKGNPSVFVLTSSLVISWIFAKSITNAADLGLSFGLVGGVAYAVYYFSFIVAGIIIYQLRTQGNFKSIHEFLNSKFGKGALIIFSLLIAFRLFNEVWSNTMVIGNYFGQVGTANYYWAIIIMTGLTLAYSLKGGLRSSLLTDAIQMIFFGLLLFILLGFILPHENTSIQKIIYSGTWKMETGLNLLFVAFLQIFSYPFHDPVLTDRGFISSPKITLKSFLIASIIGFFCILIFSFVGIFAQFNGLKGSAAVEVGKLLGVTGMLAMNFIMITSAASTLDSTFSSFSKLIIIDLGNQKIKTVAKGRIMMLLIVIIGTIPVFLNPEILSATTISGTMVMGLAPIFLCWKLKAPPLSFYLSVGFGIFVGIILTIGYFPTSLQFSEGKYADLLWANFWGIIACFILYFIPYLFFKNKKRDD